MTRRLLTQSEAAFLLAPSGRAGGDCIRSAPLALIAQGRMAVAEREKPFGSLELILGSDMGADGLAAHLRAVEMALREYRDGGRLSGAHVLAALQKRFGYGFGRYVHRHIAPDLIRLGHVVRTDTKWLGLFPRTRYELTTHGERVVAPLRRELASLDELPALVKANPSRALELAHSAGVMLVLSPIARRQIPRLRKLMAKRVGDQGPIVFAGSDTSSSVEGFESHSWIADFEGCSLFDGISAVCDATSSDGGTADGGADGGGGD